MAALEIGDIRFHPKTPRRRAALRPGKAFHSGMGTSSRTRASNELEKAESASASSSDCSIGMTTMKTLPQVTEARYVSGYRIELVFNTGLRKTVDFSRWLNGPVFEPLRNRSEFRKCFVAGGTVCWPNGADIAPETLYSVRGVSERAA